MTGNKNSVFLLIVTATLILLFVSFSSYSFKRRVLPPLPKPRDGHVIPWKLRKPWKGKPMWHPRIHELGHQIPWPKKPPSPTEINEEQFAFAIRKICLPLYMNAARKIAGPLIKRAKEFDLDPFLLAGLVYRQSRCRNKSKNPDNFGITRIPFSMYKRNFKHNLYNYFALSDGKWKKTKIRLDQYPFSTYSLRKMDANFYFASAFLKIWREVGPDIDKELKSVPHRSFISHWIWGDFIAGTGAEDRILTARRRIIQYYNNHSTKNAGKIGQLEIYSPLDGAPRLVTSPMGEIRKKTGGTRLHRGVDIDAANNEPVLAVADGFVAQSRVDLPGNKASQTLTPEEAGKFPRDKMGAGGLYICLGHGNKVHSCYMHLNSFFVKEGDTVKAGDKIGLVGRTGISASGAHLHLELRINGNPADPLIYFKNVLVHSEH